MIEGVNGLYFSLEDFRYQAKNITNKLSREGVFKSLKIQKSRTYNT